MIKNNLNQEVTTLLNGIDLPLRKEIELLRSIILNASFELKESVKWNSPNYSIGDYDRITIRINSANKIQVIFHRGAKILKQPPEKLLNNKYDILEWKSNDRAVATFYNLDQIEEQSSVIKEIVVKWLEVTQ